MASKRNQDAESRRLQQAAERKHNWKRWGPYLAERQWGTVREDYSPDGAAWDYFTHEQSRSRAYRWGEDGLLGLCDRECRLCFAVALWNGRDPILKERLFGLSGPEGNHGEDVKELYFYLDATPTHAYMKALYKYPQAAFPYAQLLDENRRRGRRDPEFEIADTGVFDGGRYFDVFVEYAKQSPNDILIRITAANRGPEAAILHLLPTLWFRNTWSWGDQDHAGERKPQISAAGAGLLHLEHATLQPFQCAAAPGPDGGAPPLLFTENETNEARLFNAANPTPYVKDAFHEYVVHGNDDAVNPARRGTKAAAHYTLNVPAGDQTTLCLRLWACDEAPKRPFGKPFDAIFDKRIAECDAFHADRSHEDLSPQEQLVVRQSYAGLLWTKQFYHYVVRDWLDGDANMPPPPPQRKLGRNRDWTHLYNRDVISMPDKWEYPWYAAWDLAFHMIPMAEIDPDFAKQQLILFLREWYMHPNGQIPAYEWALSDVNPPVHAWACWRVYKMTGSPGHRDKDFLASAFQKLLLNFTWWVNRKDAEGHHIFSGGFLGLDNIGLFDRSKPLPTGGLLQQADGTAWMAFYCNIMLAMALELAQDRPAYEDMASKFFEHFVAIADAMNSFGGTGLWDEEDGFYYDRLHLDGQVIPLRVRSLVGLIPLIAVETLEYNTIKHLPNFRKRMRWFLEHRADLARHISYLETVEPSAHPRYLLAIPSRQRLQSVLRYLLDENEFLSPFGIRSLSRVHRDKPYVLNYNGQAYRVDYEPGESTTDLFGGNSNWRGPVWLPVNLLLVTALERYRHFYGDTFKVECPTGSGRMMNLAEVAYEIGRRIASIFLPGEDGQRPCHGRDRHFAADPHFGDLLLFHEYFHAETGQGLGASHQTGWTALIARGLKIMACIRACGDMVPSVEALETELDG